MGKSSNLARTSLGVTVVLIVGYFLSFVKEASIANYYGVSAEVDAYTIAIQMPVLIFSFVAVSIKSIIIPLYSEIYYNKGAEEAGRFGSNFIFLNIIIALGIICAGEILAGPLTTLFAPGFDTATHDMAVSLMRVTLPCIIFTVLTDIFVGIANVHKKYLLPSLAVYFLNIAIILCIIQLHEKFGITAACIGQLIGGALQALYLYLIVKRSFRLRWWVDFKDPAIKKSLSMSFPVIWGISVAEVNAMVTRMVASMLFAGSIAAISYASKLNGIFMTFFVSAISTIIYPLYAESTAKRDFDQLSVRINYTLSAYCLLLVPIMFFMLCFREEIVEVAFARGAFDESAIEVTQGLLGVYSIGMVFMAFRGTVTNVFYSLKDTKTPAINSTIGAVLNIILCLTLPWFMGVNGIAIATTVAAIFISTRLLFQLKKKDAKIDLKFFIANIWKIIAASLITFIVILVVRHFIQGWNDWAVFISGVSITAIVYLMLMVWLKPPIFEKMFRMLISR